MWECFKLNETNEIIEFFKTADSKKLLDCHPDTWLPTIESPLTPGAFLTHSPDEIYKSNPPLPIDTMFSFTSQVFSNDKI